LFMWLKLRALHTSTAPVHDTTRPPAAARQSNTT
jgi:hypothetical protein